VTERDYPTPHGRDGTRCEAADPDAGQCQLAAPHRKFPHMAKIADAIMAWVESSDTVDRWPLHTVNTWFRAAPWCPEFRPSIASE
jgi:hypothetical protein